jgi:TonB family protein
VEFGILDSGALAGIKVLKSSDHAPLDHGALQAINAAPPFPPLPAHFRLDRLNIRARFCYRLVAGK